MRRSMNLDQFAAILEEAFEEEALEEPTRPYLNTLVSLLQRAQSLISTGNVRQPGGAIQVITQVANSIKHNIDRTVWAIRPTDPNLRARILVRRELRSVLPYLTAAIAHLRGTRPRSANQSLLDAIRRLAAARIHAR